MPFEADFARFLPSVGNGSSSMRHVRFPLECVVDNFKKLVRIVVDPAKRNSGFEFQKNCGVVLATNNDYQ